MWVNRFLPYSANEFIFVSSIVASPDGGFVAFATRQDRFATPGQVYGIAYKVDRDGIQLWSKILKYPDASSTRIEQAIPTPDGGYLLVGSTYAPSDNNTIGRGWAAKLDAQGNTSWQNRYNQVNGFNGAALYGAIDGTYVLNGATFSNTSTFSTSASTVIDQGGNPRNDLPVQVVPFPAFNSLATITAVPPANRPLVYVVANDTPTDMNGGDIRLTSFSAQGSVVWTKTLGGSSREYGFKPSVLATDNGFIVVGITESTDGDVSGKQTNRPATWIVKLEDPAKSFALAQPTYNCQTGAITFNTTGGDGSTITYSAPGISRSSATSNSGTVEQGLRDDPKPITITATQSGQIASYTFDFKGFCDGVQPPTSGPLTLLVPTYDCTTGAFRFSTSGGDGSTIEYRAAPGITDWTTNPNQFVDQDSRTASDVKPFTLMARQNGVTVSYVWDLRAVCPNPPAANPLTLLAPTYDCTTGSFRFNTSGGNGTLIEYQAVPGITGWTTNPNQFVDQDSRTANDVKPFTLMARQSGVLVSYVWDLKAACGRARLGVGERVAELSVSVLGNPVSEAATVEVRGAEGKPLSFRLIDLRGRLVESRSVAQAGAAERQRFDLHGQGTGLLLLRVSSGSQAKTVKIMKQ